MAEGSRNRNGVFNRSEVGGLCTRHWREKKYGPLGSLPYEFKWLPNEGEPDEVAVKRIALGASYDLPIACTKEEAIEAVAIMLRNDMETVEMTERIGCSIHMTELLRRIVHNRQKVAAA